MKLNYHIIRIHNFRGSGVWAHSVTTVTTECIKYKATWFLSAAVILYPTKRRTITSPAKQQHKKSKSSSLRKETKKKKPEVQHIIQAVLIFIWLATLPHIPQSKSQNAGSKSQDRDIDCIFIQVPDLCVFCCAELTSSKQTK